MASAEQREAMLAFYDGISGWLKPAVESLAEDADEVLAASRASFAAMLDEFPYVDRPQHTMAASMFACAAMLAVFENLRGRRVDAHGWGRAVHALPPVPAGGGDDERARADAAASQSQAASNEFVYEMVDADESGDGGMNIQSCAICHLFSRHDAMELVPYMCAFDDAMSDAANQGLRRRGTIALGATQCDFRFRKGDPLRLVEQYPDRIRLGAD
jgi:hypothetical protein